ncbi:Membrane protein of ER body-like protein [Sesamum alatum]|uniref:Membrane protein of ER body-like protein n=1 Tax=Sesamum alatum TaxID=300844 RepID=A0AAE1YP82_9LAMI|nr:Membrane protein of ER body-like protein [Sesamum alatum]
MEKEEQKWEVEEQEEEEETSLVVRKSRNGNDSKTTEIAAVDVGVSNGVSESNGHPIQSEVAANGAQSEGPVLGEEQKIEELDGVLENESQTINGAQSEDPILGEEQKIEKLYGVLANESETINKEQKSQNLVFYDKVEGIWKCRICTWTYQNGSVCVDHIRNHKGQLHKLICVKTLNFESRGIEPASTYFGEKQIVKDPGYDKFDVSSLDFATQNNATSAIDNGYTGDHENDSFSSSNLQPSQISVQEHSISYKSSKEIESAEVDLINGDDLEVTELDVERVLQKQTTHDLYCPNCNSCITKRVILRKRKRRIRLSDEEIKRNKIEAAVDSKLGAVSSQSVRHQVVHTDEVGDNATQLPTAENDERERGPDIFRCLSCFSFFIPTGNGFKLFRAFGEKDGKQNDQGEQAPRIKKNWFTSMFASNKQETAIQQGSSSQTDVQKVDVGAAPSSILGDQSGQPSFSQKTNSPSHASESLQVTAGTNGTPEGRDQILPSPRQKPSLNGKVIIGSGDKLDMTATEPVDATMKQFDAYPKDQLTESKPEKEVRVNRETDLSGATLPLSTHVTNGESAEDAISFSQQDGLKLLISSNKESLTLENSERRSNWTMQSGAADKEAIQLPPKTVSVLRASDVDGNLNISVSIPHEEQDITATILTESVVENKNANFRSGNNGQAYPTEVSQHIITKTKFEVHSGESLGVDNIISGAPVAQGKDTVITIDAQPAGSSQTLQGIIRPTETEALLQSASQTQISTAGRRRSEARKEVEIEVIKSIVYGGLAESITSLSVVSSAAGGGAATLNILALGVANLIGGLFIICHNLWELRSDRVEQQVANQVSDGARDRYKELLGRRQNFILHAVVAIISYLVFGLVPPVVYGFSFRKTDDKQLKLVVVAAASLVCILVLAIGRAYIQRPPKPYFKTIITFVTLGVMVSGVSYAAGELVERLLEKLGLFQSSSVPNLLVPEIKPTGSAWASY